MPKDFIKYTQPTDDQRNELIVPVEAGSIINTSKNVDTDWFASNISPSISGRPTMFRLVIRMATTSVVYLEVDDGATTNIRMNLNDGIALDANDLYMFDVMILDGQSFNIKHTTGIQAVFVNVVELGKFT